MNSDAELLGRYVRENSNPAFAELVQRHMGMVYGAALRKLGGAHDLAEDVAQNVFVALARKARTLQNRRTLAGWLYLSTQHAAAQVARTESRRRSREEAHTMQEHLTREMTPEWERIQELLDPAMTRLRETERDAVLLRYVEGRSFAEIGSLLKISADAARMRVDRALDRLRALLEQRGITSTAAALGAVLSSHAAPLPASAFATRVSQVATAIRATDTSLPAGGAWAALAAVAAIGIGTGVYHARQSQKARLELQVVALQRNEAFAQLAREREDAQGLRQQPDMTRSAAQEQAGPPRSGGASSATTPASPGNRVASGEVKAWTASTVDGRKIGSHYFVDTPSGRRESIGAAVADRFAPYFRKMGWSTEQQSKFADLFFERKEMEKQMIRQAIERGQPPTNESIKEIVQRAGRDFDAKLTAAFGAGAVDTKRDFEAKIPFRNIADALAKRLFDSNSPLLNWQADQLVDLMANSASKSGSRFDIQSMESSLVLNQAQAFLSAPQLAALRVVDAEQRKQRELEQRMLAERATLSRDNAPTPGK